MQTLFWLLAGRALLPVGSACQCGWVGAGVAPNDSSGLPADEANSSFPQHSLRPSHGHAAAVGISTGGSTQTKKCSVTQNPSIPYLLTTVSFETMVSGADGGPGYAPHTVSDKLIGQLPWQHAALLPGLSSDSLWTRRKRKLTSLHSYTCGH